MKRYKLLKDLPFAKAGDIFKGELEYGTTVLFPEDYENYKHKLSSDEFWDFDEWFEEVGEPEWVYYINAFGGVVDNVRVANLPGVRASLKSTGNYFETREEAEKYLAYLKAKAIIKKDVKEFRFDWTDRLQLKYRGYLIPGDDELKCTWDCIFKESTIYFESYEDIQESFKKHPEEWKTYLTYEQ